MERASGGRRPVDDARVAAVLRLLGEGRPKTRIAEHVGISVGSVKRIAKGQHVSQAEDAEPRLVRCGGCGGMVKLPCIACELRDGPGVTDQAET